MANCPLCGSKLEIVKFRWLTNFLGLSTQALGLLIILGIILLNVGFILFLKVKQPIL